MNEEQSTSRPTAPTLFGLRWLNSGATDIGNVAWPSAVQSPRFRGPEAGPARRALLFSPLLPDDYLELVNPLWSTQELRGRIEQIERETDSAVTVFIRPGYEWPGQKPGQYMRVGVIVDGVRHWRAYSLTSEPTALTAASRSRPRGRRGVVSPYLSRCSARRHRAPGRRRGRLRAPRRAARPAAVHLRRQRRDADHVHAAQPRTHDAVGDAVHLHSARTRGRRHLRPPPRELARRHEAISLHCSSPASTGRRAGRPRRAVPGLARTRGLPSRAPASMLDASTSTGSRRHATACTWSASSRRSAAARRARVARSSSCKQRREAESDGYKPILVAGEEAGSSCPSAAARASATRASGSCARARCATCATARSTGSDGEIVRTCISAPEGRVEIEL